MDYILNIGKAASEGRKALSLLSGEEKNNILKGMEDALLDNVSYIIDENKKDLDKAREKGLTPAFIDRLTLTKERIESMVEGVRTIRSYKDPIGSTVRGWKLENGLKVEEVRTPIGVIGMIFESRPNVTVDAAALCLKSGNAIILRGGSDAIHSNIALSRVIIEAGIKHGLPKGAISLIEKTDRSLVKELLSLSRYIDLIIPRGGKGLKEAIMRDSKIPVIVTGAGICHLYIDKDADKKMALDILLNGKTQRPGVCNALETLLVHKDRMDILVEGVKLLVEKGVKIIGCEKTLEVVEGGTLATNEDWETEYHDLVISIKIVDGVEESIDHINTFGTNHSEAIVTSSYEASEKFLREVDAACVYVNASTRFTDGGEFGFGGEIGISTQKIHARGPMGIDELTSTKYLLRGEGHIRK